MEPPDHASHHRARYELDSFANFDRLAADESGIGYPTVPKDNDDPGPVATLLIIMRGRLRAAAFGEDAGINAPQIRNDLDDVARRIANLAERHRASAQRYRHESRTLPGLAYARLVYFGSDLVREPVEMNTNEDVENLLDRSLREWGTPKRLVLQVVNGERLEGWEQRSAEELDASLKRESERLHRELVRRLPSEGASGGSQTALAPIRISTSTLDDISNSGLSFTEFVELMLARLVEADRQQPGAYVDLVPLAEELKQETPQAWIFDARTALEQRGLVRALKVLGRTAPAMLTGEGRLYVEQGGETGIINEYTHHRSNFVIVTGSNNQIAVGVEGDVHQTSVTAGVPREAFDLLDRIEELISSDQSLVDEDRNEALDDVRAARGQLEKKEPNKRAAIALLDPLAKIATVGGFIAKILSLLA
jgi:hypothetical protein